MLENLSFNIYWGSSVKGFPILNLYRILFHIGALIVLLVGAITVYREGSASNEGFAMISILMGLIPFIATSTLLVFFAEIIKLGLKIESHLEKIANRS